MGELPRDLAIRDEIAELISDVPPQFAVRLQEWLAPLDRTFMQATRAVDDPLLPAGDGETLGAWWYRMPLSVRPVDPDVAASWSR